MNAQEFKSGVKSSETVKSLREQQIEERIRKNAERQAAVEERRKQIEHTKKEALRAHINNKTQPKPSGRKLPNVPDNGVPYRSQRETVASRRLSSSSSSSEGYTPTTTSGGTKSARRNLTGPSSLSTSSLSNYGSIQNLSKPRSSFGSSKTTSASTNNLSDNESRMDRGGGQGRVHEVAKPGRRSLGSNLPKAQSLNAIHKVGGRTLSSQPPSGKKGNRKAKPVHHAGTSNEAEASKALAEHRKRLREEAERKALLDKEKQEELRKQHEEEEKKQAEENARELLRQAELVKQFELQQEERARQLHEQQEREALIEAEKMATELKHKEEIERLRQEELERKIAENKQREQEEVERLKQEELERLERKKKVEMIMSRTRLTSNLNNNLLKSDSYSSLEDLSMKLSDECHSSAITEILQKVKEKSHGSTEKDWGEQKENHKEKVLKNSTNDKDESSSSEILKVIDNSKYGSNVNGRQFLTNKSKDVSQTSDGNFEIGSHSDKHSTSRRTLKDSYDDNIHPASTPGVSQRTQRDIRDTSVDNTIQQSASHEERSCDKLRDHLGIYGDTDDTSRFNDGLRIDDERLSSNETARHSEGGLWSNVEQTMTRTGESVGKDLERNCLIVVTDVDEESEEGELWNVVEGRRSISEVI